jgi:hypothetical protein
MTVKPQTVNVNLNFNFEVPAATLPIVEDLRSRKAVFRV